MNFNVMKYGISEPFFMPIKEIKNDRAWTDTKDHVIISISGHELGMDLIAALKLYKQLGEAIKKAI